MYTLYDVYDHPIGFFKSECRAEDYKKYLSIIREEGYIQYKPNHHVLKTDNTEKVDYTRYLKHPRKER